MDNFARLPSDERRLYFEQSAARRGLSAQIVEKDFWVCWCLRRLFLLKEFRDHLTFKGGTTLSKVYRVIERFSEDVDVAIEREFLGFGGENEPEAAPTGKPQKSRISALKKACQAAIADRLQPQLRDAIAIALGHYTGWGLTLDPSDPDCQSLQFHYPPTIAGSPSPYFAGSVRIELGARSDHFPVENRTVTPYAAEEFPDAFPDAQVPVRVLAASRTFWEKATILHRLHHLPEDGQLQPRMSRHYYDVFQLSNSPVWQDALDSMDLLDRVVEQTVVFFHRAWARYEEARMGLLRLSPPRRIVAELARDYRAMQPMFFRDPPPFDQILAHLPVLEDQINGGSR